MEKIHFQSLIEKHKLFTTMLFELFKSLLISYKIKYHVIEQRTKTIESLEEKISRKQIYNIDDEITDLSGLRIILYYQDDVDSIIKMITENFDIDKENSVNKAELYNSNEFGYLSIHYIVSINALRKKLPEWMSFDKLKAEIQIRTVLQHSWASISHELTYKKNYEIPKELQRKLYRLAGLFELADEQFLKIRDEHIILEETIKNLSVTNKIELESINLLTLKYSFLKQNTIFNEINLLALELGFTQSENYIMEENHLSEIVLASEILGLKFIKDLEEVLSANKNEIKQYLKILRRKVKTTWTGDKLFFNLLSLLFIFDSTQMEYFRKITNWHKSIIEYINEVIEEVEKKKLQ